MWMLIPLLFLGSLIHPVQMSPWQMFQNMCHSGMLVQGPQCIGNPNQQQPSFNNQQPFQSSNQQQPSFNNQQVPTQQERPPFAGAPGP